MALGGTAGGVQASSHIRRSVVHALPSSLYTYYGLTATLSTCTGAGVGEGDGNNEDPRRWGWEAAQLFAPACTSAAVGTGGTTFHVDAGS